MPARIAMLAAAAIARAIWVSRPVTWLTTSPTALSVAEGKARGLARTTAVAACGTPATVATMLFGPASQAPREKTRRGEDRRGGDRGGWTGTARREGKR